MESKARVTDRKTVNLSGLKERLGSKLPPDSPVLSDLLREPDIMPIDQAEVLIPHYLQRLERELQKCEASGPMVLSL